MRDSAAYFNKEMPDAGFCVDIFYRQNLKQGENMKTHWHEHLQFYYFIGGEGVVGCGHNRFQVSTGSLAVINSNELHYLESLSDNLQFYVVRIDPKFLFSNQVDLVQTKYLAPLTQNLITFKNLIENDCKILDCFTNMLGEYHEKQAGYELAVKSSVYQLIVLLFRGYVNKVLTQEEFKSKTHILQSFDAVFQMIDEHYSERISLQELAARMNISPCHFCRLFKQIAGKTATLSIDSRGACQNDFRGLNAH
jgi:YesN/AraC family two-component response regulator